MTDTDREMQESQRRKRPGKQKKKKKSKKGWLVLIVTVGLILAVVFGCRIKTIRITGNERVSDETIQTLIQYDKCQNNSLLLWLLNRKTDISSEPLLNSIHVQLRNPQTIVVQVNEEKLSGYVQSEDEYIYVNDSGKIVLKQTEKLQDVLLLNGITADTAEVGEQLVSDDTGVFADFLDIAAILRSEAITADSLGKSDDGGYYIVMGKVKVLLGKDIYMEEKISELNDLLSKLEGLSGTLHLEEYDSTKDSIIFTKDS